MMKKVWKQYAFLAVVMFIVSAILAGCGSSNEPAKTTAARKDPNASATLNTLREKGALIVGSSNDAPFAYIDATNNQFSGVDADIIREVAKRLGINKVEMKQIPFENLLIELNNGTVDMVTDAMYIKPERLEKALFTDVWYKEGEAVVVKKDSSIQTKEDLKDKVVGGQKGTAFLEVAQKWLSEGKVRDLKIFSNQAELMMAVNTGKIDACVTDGIVAGYTIKQDSSLNLKILSPYEAEAAGKIGAALRFEDKEFLAEVNKALNDMKQDGTLMKILQQYGLNEDYFVAVDDGKTQNVK
ncbi:putative secreted protein [Propionispora sp. 2/2-37]|uniref:substrate-binding periplasmic protein n=1 Tax=Propionispora sp. 2/2-37 TaxID=1677858 RepID=UPI0006C5DAA3|nr:ABC transporter substrate-binding protein [Propionispora sp. 2/2-37]CUH96837.1 putative secreted protein [Propionispora sp. 2/2-37]